ncbi:MAG: glycosyltransferase [Rickettsiales bacterium]|nr:glycosyltransferase [Rickettsiales bacterium]
MPKVSIIMPAFNDGEYIGLTICSLIAQTFTDWELIIVNDGSSDNTLDVANEYAAKDSRIHVIHQDNQGVIAARNNAIQHAIGKYIFPLDSDDIIAPECIEKLYKVMINSKYDVVAPNVGRFGRFERIDNYPQPTPYNMSNGNKIVTSSLFLKSDWEKYGGYDSDFKGGFEGFAFWMNFLEDGKKIYRIPDVLFFYRMKPETQSRHFNADKNYHDFMKIMADKFPLIRKYSRIRRVNEFVFKVKKNKKVIVVRLFKIPVLVLPRFTDNNKLDERSLQILRNAGAI